MNCWEKVKREELDELAQKVNSECDELDSKEWTTEVKRKGTRDEACVLKRRLRWQSGSQASCI